MCPRQTWTEQHPFAAKRAKLTARAIDWDTCRNGIAATARGLVKQPGRLQGIKTIGVDEHIWRPSKVAAADKAMTIMVDLTRDEHGCLHARLLDAVQGRSGKAYAGWLTDSGLEFKMTVEHAALDPFRGGVNRCWPTSPPVG